MSPGRILGMALAGAVAILLATLWLALQEPWLGLSFAEPAGGGVGLVVESVAARAASAGVREGDAVRTVRADGKSFDIPAGWLVETPSYFIRYGDYNAFLDGQRRLHALLGAQSVALQRVNGSAVTLTPSHRSLADLPAAFWYQIVYAVLAYSVGAALLAFRSGDAAARWFALATFAFFLGTLMRAFYGSRALVIDAGWLRASLAIAHAAGLVGTAALANFAWHFPRRLGAGPIPALLIAAAALTWCIDFLQLMPTTNLAYRGPLVIVCLLIIGFSLAQWWTSRHDAVFRVLARWLMLLLIAGPLIWGAGLVAVGLGIELPIPRGSHGLSSVILIYLGMVLLILRHRAFDLERWWFESWIWFLCGALVIGLDLLLVRFLSLQTAVAIGVSLALVGWLYFPLRQWLLARLWRRSQQDLRELFPELVRIVLAPAQGGAPLAEGWRTLLARIFDPRSIESADGNASAVRIEDGGLRLVIPGAGGGRAIALRYAADGARLFSRRDARLAQSLLDLLRHGAGYHDDGYRRGVASERDRIARDLHDDIGAKLLTLIHESSSPRVTSLARSAVAEMREVVTELRAQPLTLLDALADWRAELAERCAAADASMQWHQPEVVPDVMLSPRHRLAIGRVLRESTSNALRHAAARSIAVRVSIPARRLEMQFSHDGRIDDPAGWQEGMGLASMRRRVSDMGGTISWRVERPRDIDARLHLDLSIPLDARLGGGTTEAPGTAAGSPR